MLFKSITKSLTGKLTIVLGVLILSGSGVFWYLSIKADQKDLMDNVIAFVSSFSEVVKRSVRYDMLLFQREGIQRTLESIGASESIRRVRIFDSKGRVFYSSKREDIGQTVPRDSPACIGCHRDPINPQVVLTTERRWNIYEEPTGYRALSFVEPIYNEQECYSAACHAHNRKQKVLGILATDFSLHPIDIRTKKQMIHTSVYMILFLAVSIALLYYILWRVVLKPVTSLSKGMSQVSSGDLLQKVPVSSEDEIGKLARTFNAMTDELIVARQKMAGWARILEEEVQRTADEIKRTQGKLVQAEKLAALGRLTSDIAHEIRNPLTALGGFGRRLLKFAVNDKEKEYANIVVSEVGRLEHILRDVLTFSRDARLHFEKLPVTDVVKESISTFAEMCDEHNINVEVDFGTVLPVLIDKGQVRQAVNNLITNAIDVMPGGGTLSVDTVAENLNNITYVAIHISDTGPGVPEAQLPRIFEPFHTTKEIGHGTGLGLSISRKIMEEHGGFIKAENKATRGLIVSLYFPHQSDEECAKTPCWEFMKCGREADAELKCPSYPNFGRSCWVVAGTFCEGKVQGAYAQKCEDCRKCEFYKKVLKSEI